MAEYASKGVAGTALGLGIAGTVGLVNQMSGGNGLGGLFGGGNAGMNNQITETLRAENAMLKSENYADKIGKEVYNAHLAELNRFKEGGFADVAKEVAANRERVAVLEAQVKCGQEKALLREQLIDSKIDRVAEQSACGLNALNQTVACLTGKVDGITKTIVPAGAICPRPMPRFNSWIEPKCPCPPEFGAYPYDKE